MIIIIYIIILILFFSWLLTNNQQGNIEDEFSKVDNSLSMLKQINIAAHCKLPPMIREKILSCSLRSLSLLCEKYLYLSLNRSSDGTLRENCGRRQMFIDLAGAFAELSLLLTDMYREGLIQAEGDDLIPITTNGGSKAYDYVNSLIFGHEENENPKIIEEKIKNRNSLVSAARWVLKLEMSILTEDWARMDILSSVERPSSLPQCPGVIEVLNLSNKKIFTLYLFISLILSFVCLYYYLNRVFAHLVKILKHIIK